MRAPRARLASAARSRGQTRVDSCRVRVFKVRLTSSNETQASLVGPRCFPSQMPRARRPVRATLLRRLCRPRCNSDMRRSVLHVKNAEAARALASVLVQALDPPAWDSSLAQWVWSPPSARIRVALKSCRIRNVDELEIGNSAHTPAGGVYAVPAWRRAACPLTSSTFLASQFWRLTPDWLFARLYWHHKACVF